MYVFYVPKHSLRGIFEHALAALYAKTVNRFKKGIYSSYFWIQILYTSHQEYKQSIDISVVANDT